MSDMPLRILKLLATNFIPELALPLAALECINNANDRAAQESKMDALTRRVQSLETEKAIREIDVRAITENVVRTLRGSSGGPANAKFRLFLTNVCSVWAPHAIHDEITMRAVKEHVDALAEQLHYYCQNATVIVVRDLPGPDIDFVETTLNFHCCARLDASSLGQEDAGRLSRIIRAAVDEAAYRMSFQIGFPSLDKALAWGYQPISMRRIIEDVNVWQYHINTEGWSGVVNLRRIENLPEFVQPIPRSIASYSAYRLRAVYSERDWSDLSGRFIFFEKLRPMK